MDRDSRDYGDGIRLVDLNDPSSASVNSKPLRTLCLERNVYNLCIMSVSFALTFTGWSTTQGFTTKLLPGPIGAVSLALVYGSFCLCNFVAPTLVSKWGARKALIAGGLCYSTFVGSMIFIVTPFVLLSAAILGLGAALIWTAQGVYATEITNVNNRGRFGGIFWGVFQICVLPGNIASYFFFEQPEENDGPSGDMLVLGWNDEDSILFVLLFGCTLVGAMSFLLLFAPDPATGSVKKNIVGSRGIVAQIKIMMKLVIFRRMLLFTPLMFASGFFVTYWAGWFTRQQEKRYLGLNMAALGMSEIIGSIALGRASDRFGKTKVIIFAVAMQILGLAVGTCANMVHMTGEQGEMLGTYLFFLGAPLLGLADCGVQTQIMVHLGSDFPEQTADAFAIYKCVQALGATVGFCLTPLFGEGKASVLMFSGQGVMVGGVMLAALLAYARMLRSPLPMTTTSMMISNKVGIV